MLPAQRFWRETVSLLAIMWPRSNQWERALLGKNFQFCCTTELRDTPHSILMTCHYEDLSSTFDWLKQIYNHLNFCACFSDFTWRENQCCRFKMLAFFSGYGVYYYINAWLVILSSALEISSQSGVIPARTSQKITATAYPSRRIAYKFKLSYELLSMFGMYAVVSVVQCLKCVYMRRFAITIFRATQRCNIVTTLFGIVTTLFQHCKALLH